LRVRAALNGFALWLMLIIGLIVINYGYPIAQLLTLKGQRRSRRLRGSHEMSFECVFFWKNNWFSANVGHSGSCRTLTYRRICHLPFATPYVRS
jgi:hypothetical protein